MGNENIKKPSQEEIECLQEATGLDSTKIHECWETFNLMTAGEDNLTLEMTKQIVPMFIGPLKENFIERMFRIFDSDDNGYIDFKEFIIGTTILNLKDPGALAKLVYKIGDIDCNHGIDREEFEKLGLIYLDFGEHNEFEINELKKKFAVLIDTLFEKYDESKKGYLSEQEFGLAFKDLELDETLGLSRLQI